MTTNARLSPYLLETTCLIAPFMELRNKNMDYGLNMDYGIAFKYTKDIALNENSIPGIG